ncbi:MULTISPECIES: Crp/Fnr family transcriptional regulator [unclassified Rhizobium]|jgi:CRP-like cAMP-binding protein|uniref:Crp/Fnr family transcriptional regulator n=1 Tax=unclassified Rhizobium TaxID=2613769 RepID=UPI0009DC9AD2|nr:MULTISPECIES: Crp/Fnr family transcriptional regulator [unclassified Rhizobium]RKD56157.1 Crp/Fnr family transcriptional regulator [Rhizobium sp. WW_1]
MPHDLLVLNGKLSRPSSSTSRNVHLSPFHMPGFSLGKEALNALVTRKRIYMKGCDIIHEDRQARSAYLIYTGWACSYRLLRNGTRQIINFHVQGDLLGARRLLSPDCDDNLSAITCVEVGEIDIDNLLAAFFSDNHLAMSILWSTFRDESIVTQHLVDIGRLRPINRTAHFFLELGARLNLAGVGTGTTYQCPLTQSLIADALGLTTVHFNRVLRQLRELNTMIFHEGQVELLDSARLERLADFDSSYLR